MCVGRYEKDFIEIIGWLVVGPDMSLFGWLRVIL